MSVLATKWKPSLCFLNLKKFSSSHYFMSLLNRLALNIFLQWFLFTCSVQFSRSVVSNCLRPHELQHARSPCPSPTPGVHSNSHPLSQWCHPAISSSVVPFFSCPQSLPASGSFPMSQLFPRGGQSTGVSVSASFLPKKSQGWYLSECSYVKNLNILKFI